MTEVIRKSEKGGNSIYMQVGVWYQPETGEIHLTVPGSGWFHTTVNNKPNSKRGHPNLYGKLARALREKDAPAPEVSEVE